MGYRIRRNAFNLVGLAILLSATMLAACQPAASQPAVEVDRPAVGQPVTAKQQLQGTVEAIGANSLTVNGQTVALPAGYMLDERLSVGDRVLITGAQGANGVLLVSSIIIESDMDEVEIVGTLEALDATSATIDGQTYALLPGAEIKAGVVVGALVKVHLVPQADGSFAIREMELAEDDDDHEREIVGTLEALDATSATIDGQTYALLPGAEIKAGVVVGALVKVHLVPQADGSFAIREMELAEDDDLDDDSGDDDGDDDSGIAGEYEVVGTLEAITATNVTVNGTTYGITRFTEFKNGVQVGDYVKLHVVVMSDGSHIVREIELADSPSGDDSNNGDDDDDQDDSDDDDHSGDDDDDQDDSDSDDDGDDDHGGSGDDDDDEKDDDD